MARLAAVALELAGLALRDDGFRRLDLGRQWPDHRRAHGQLDAREGGLLGLPAREHALGIMRLDPALEEARGHRQLDGVGLAAVELHAREPARIDVIADLGAKTVLHAAPSILIHAHCCWSLLRRTGWGGTRTR